jgi:two-component system, chemotaxis family, protein-glutamate methylesterase/glutaminase
MRRLLSDALRRCGVEIVAEACDGAAALEVCARVRPDVLTLDLQMPGLSGIDVLRRLRSRGPGVVVVSAHTNEGSALAVEALTLGAADVVRKPHAGMSLADFTPQLLASVEAAAAARRYSRVAVRPTPATQSEPIPAQVPRRRTISSAKLVVIACSTGGPQALASLVPRLPSPCGAGVVIVQHMPPGFTKQLAARLNASSALEVREAVDGDRIEPGVALLAPGGFHLRLDGKGARLSEEPPIGGLRPRADITIGDAAREWRDRLVLMVLTGMGSDALDGARSTKAAGGTVLTQSEGTCVVYGMPRSVEEAGLTDAVAGLDALPSALAGALR